jgi:hypothetical protein
VKSWVSFGLSLGDADCARADETIAITERSAQFTDFMI